MRAGGTAAPLTADQARALYRAERRRHSTDGVMAEARAEFEAWAAQPRVVYVPLLTGGERRLWFKVVVGRTKTRAPRPAVACACGRPAWKTGRCMPCYWRAYNATRVRRAPKRQTATQLAARPACACGAPVWARGQCRSCYMRDYNARRPNRARGRQVA